MSCVESPTRFFVHELIDWNRVRHRLERYPAIGRAFPYETLESYSDKAPYYCHYMAWRLGTWNTESYFDNLATLLCRAEKLPNWEHESSLLDQPDYGAFWSLVWQLQVAAYLCKVGENVRWGETAGGPDLSVHIDGEQWFVECYCMQKSYGLLEFLQECLSKILRISVQDDYRRYLRMSLPQGSEIVGFLDQHLKPFCCPAYRDRARQRDVEIIYEEPGGVRVVVEDGDHDGDVPSLVAGSPRGHVATMLREALNNKEGKNRLSEHRPNVLAVNLLLTDSRGAEILRPNVIGDVAADLSQTAIDVLVASSETGIADRQARLVIASARTDELGEAARWLVV